MSIIKTIYADGTAEEEFFSQMQKRSGETDKKVTAVVSEILENVKNGGDKAVIDYTKQFDGVKSKYYEVPREIINDALTEADQKFVDALLSAMENITEFHSKQKSRSFIDPKENGVILGQRVRGLDKVGLYVPGGTAAYPSSVIMNAVPAKIAGVKEIIMVTPPLKNGLPNKDILVAAAICGVDRVFLAGGAQAVAALAYGTEQIPKVDKIVGPGNIYVATKKNTPVKNGRLDIRAVLSELYNRGVYSVFVECGGTLAGSILKEGLADEVYQFIAPKLLNDNSGLSCFNGDNVSKISNCIKLDIYEYKKIGADMLLKMRLLQK